MLVVTTPLANDEEIEKSGVDYRALWCPALMDNMLGNVQIIKQQGMFFSPSHPNLKTPRVVTKDVSAMGAKMQGAGDAMNLITSVLYTGVILLLCTCFFPFTCGFSSFAAFVSLIGCWLPLARYQALTFRCTEAISSFWCVLPTDCISDPEINFDG